MSAFLPPIHLPWFITLHALGLLALGFTLLLRSPGQAQQQKQQQEKPSSAILGIAVTGLGLSYVSTAYMPIEQNAFLHASVPVRVILGLLAAAKVGMGVSREERGMLWAVAGYDGIGGLVAGWYLGSWNGRAPGL